MRADATPSGLYTPQPYTGTDNPQLVQWLSAELERISVALELAVARNVEVSYVAPDKPRDGNVVFADGTKWNPGSGQGFYGYYNAGWHFLG